MRPFKFNVVTDGNSEDSASLQDIEFGESAALRQTLSFGSWALLKSHPASLNGEQFAIRHAKGSRAAPG